MTTYRKFFSRGKRWMVKLILLIVLVLVAFLTTPKAYDYILVKDGIDAASWLAEKGRYAEAVEKLQSIEHRWTTPRTQATMRSLLDEYKDLAISSMNFNDARFAYDNGNYDLASDLFKNVSRKDIKYESAQKWILLIEGKKDKEAQPEYAAPPAYQPQDYASNLTSPIPLPPTPVPTPALNIQPQQKQADLGKAVAILRAITSAAKYQADASLYWDDLMRYKGEWLKCSDDVYSRLDNSDVSLSPSQYRSIIDTCKDGFQDLIDEAQKSYDRAQDQFNEYNRQLNELLSQCSAECQREVKKGLESK